MALLEQVTERHARRQQAIGRRTAAQLARLWSSVDSGSIAASWRALLPQALAILSAGQAAAAAGADGYLNETLAAQDLVADAAGRVSVQALAGIASDGRPLRSLLYQPAISALTELQGGSTLARARASGLFALDLITRTQVADAGRAAETVGMTARPRIPGYVRMLNQPSCSRCIVLAGKWFKWNTGFKRHPRCDCRHIPAPESAAGDLTTDPKLAFGSMSSAEQDRAFTKAGAAAIRQGADIGQVVNARRGMDTAVVFGQHVQHTREGVTRFGIAGRRLGNSPVRLMPEQILKEAKNREDAIRLLKKYAYIM